MSTTRADRTAHWQSLVDTWQASALSARRFCREQKLSYSQFLYWADKLRPDAQRGPTPTSGFTRVVPHNRTSSDAGLHITLPNGVRIGGIDAENAKLLSTLLAQL